MSNSTIYCAEVVICLMNASCPKTDCQNERPWQAETSNIAAQSLFAVSDDIPH